MKLGFGTNLGKKEEGELGHWNEGENAVAMMKKVHCGCRMRVHGKTRFCECETCLILILCGEVKTEDKSEEGFANTSLQNGAGFLWLSFTCF